MTARRPPHAAAHAPKPGDGATPDLDLSASRAVAEAERASSSEWAVLVRPPAPRKQRVRQIAIDACVVLAALLIVALLS